MLSRLELLQNEHKLHLFEAMEILGFKVADVGATFMYFTQDWLDFIDGNLSITDLIQKYDKMGFNMNNDL